MLEASQSHPLFTVHPRAGLELPSPKGRHDHKSPKRQREGPSNLFLIPGANFWIRSP